jgi:hypothetical protein
MADVNPLDPSTPVGQLRLLISDSQLRFDPLHPEAPAEYYYSDDFLEKGFLGLTGGNIYFAAADALTAFAANDALVSKKIRKENLQTDGPAVANALRLLAQDYRARGKAVEESGEAADGTFAIVDFADPVTPFDVFEANNGGVLWH